MATPAPARTELTRRLGGPIGGHAAQGGFWRNPAPWTMALATLGWLLALGHRSLCAQSTPDNPVDGFVRLCYSDVPILYQTTPLGTGGWPYRDLVLDQPPLTGAFVALATALSRLFGATGSSPQQVVDGTRIFTTVSAAMLFACLLVMCACHLLLGRDSARSLATRPSQRTRSWDAVLVAGCPLVVTSGMVSWDLFTASLASCALLAWALRRQRLAGVLAGLAMGAGTWPVLVLLAWLLLASRAGRMREALSTARVAVAVWALAWLAAMPVQSDLLATQAVAWWRRESDLGSAWLLLESLGVRIPALSVLVLALMAAWVLWVADLVRRAPRRPRVGQVALLLVAGWLLVGKGYSPQQVLWLVPLVALARPRLGQWAIWCGTEFLYWWAVWAHLGGQSAPADGSQTDVVYLAAVLLRIVGLLWLVGCVAGQVRRPWTDPVRGPSVDDPAGGVLDHAPDHEPDAARRVDDQKTSHGGRHRLVLDEDGDPLA